MVTIKLMDELAIVKMQAMEDEIRTGKKKIINLAEVRRRFPDAFPSFKPKL